MSKNQEKQTFRQELKVFFALKGVFTLRSTVVMGLMTALSVVMAMFLTFTVNSTFKAFSIAYLPGAVVAMLYGPWAALAYGFVSDTVKYIANPFGPYFPGYALSEMLSYFFYACFFFRRPVRVWRVIAARLLVLGPIVFGMNFLWQMILSGKAASAYFTGARLTSNSLQFPFHTALIFLTLMLVQRVLKQGRWNLL